MHWTLRTQRAFSPYNWSPPRGILRPGDILRKGGDEMDLKVEVFIGWIILGVGEKPSNELRRMGDLVVETGSRLLTKPHSTPTTDYLLDQQLVYRSVSILSPTSPIPTAVYQRRSALTDVHGY